MQVSDAEYRPIQMKVRQLKCRKSAVFEMPGRAALSGKHTSNQKRGRLGIARGRFEVPATFDAHDADIVRLFEASDAERV